MPARPEQAAHELYTVLRELDAEGVHLIWVESRRPVSNGTAFATASAAPRPAEPGFPSPGALWNDSRICDRRRRALCCIGAARRGARGRLGGGGSRVEHFQPARLIVFGDETSADRRTSTATRTAASTATTRPSRRPTRRSPARPIRSGSRRRQHLRLRLPAVQPGADAGRDAAEPRSRGGRRQGRRHPGADRRAGRRVALQLDHAGRDPGRAQRHPGAVRALRRQQRGGAHRDAGSVGRGARQPRQRHRQHRRARC